MCLLLLLHMAGILVANWELAVLNSTPQFPVGSWFIRFSWFRLVPREIGAEKAVRGLPFCFLGISEGTFEALRNILVSSGLFSFLWEEMLPGMGILRKNFQVFKRAIYLVILHA